MVMARDRLSACLFLFVMEALSRLVERAVGGHLFQVFQWGLRKAYHFSPVI